MKRKVFACFLVFLMVCFFAVVPVLAQEVLRVGDSRSLTCPFGYIENDRLDFRVLNTSKLSKSQKDFMNKWILENSKATPTDFYPIVFLNSNPVASISFMKFPLSLKVFSSGSSFQCSAAATSVSFQYNASNKTLSPIGTTVSSSAAGSYFSSSYFLPVYFLNLPLDWTISGNFTSFSFTCDDGLIPQPTPTPVPKYGLTIDYVYAAGDAAAESYTAQLETGESFNVDSPDIDGYTASLASVSGVMGNTDLHYTVTYTPRPTPTPEPTPSPTPEPTPSPPPEPTPSIRPPPTSPPINSEYVVYSDESISYFYNTISGNIGTAGTVAIYAFLIVLGIFLLFELSQYFFQ